MEKLIISVECPPSVENSTDIIYFFNDGFPKFVYMITISLMFCASKFPKMDNLKSIFLKE